MKILTLLFTLFFISVYASTNISIFAAADNSMHYILNENIESIRIGSEDTDVIIVIMADTPAGTYRFLIRNGNIDTLSITENVNAGNSNTVSDFFINSFNSFKAERNIAVLWDHGNGWYEFKSILYDNYPDDFISIIHHEFRNIFSDINNSLGRNLDMLVFDACDMQSIEVLYEIREYVDYTLGSPVRMLYNGYPYEEMIKIFDNEDNTRKAGIAVADLYFNHYEDEVDSLCMSLVDMNGISLIADKLNNESMGLMSRINEMDLSIETSIINDYVHTISDKDYLSGIKVFCPLYYNNFISLYRDYLSLDIQRDHDIIGNIFRLYGIEDTVPPEQIDDYDIIDDGYSNIRIEFDKPYDFSGIQRYHIYAINEKNAYEETFSDTSIIMPGNYNSDYYVTKPYSLYSDTLFLAFKSIYDNHLLGLYYRSMDDSASIFIISENDTILIDHKKSHQWEYAVIPFKGNDFYICYSGKGDYAYFDDIVIYSGDFYNVYDTYNNVYTIHKLSMGNYRIFIEAEDMSNNSGIITDIIPLSIVDSLFPYVYPNPVNNTMHIRSDITGDYTVRLFTASGNSIAEFTGYTNNGNIIIDIGDIIKNNGVYFFTINSRKGKFAVIR